jgi:hypothetical protein
MWPREGSFVAIVILCGVVIIPTCHIVSQGWFYTYLVGPQNLLAGTADIEARGAQSFALWRDG